MDVQTASVSASYQLIRPKTRSVRSPRRARGRDRTVNSTTDINYKTPLSDVTVQLTRAKKGMVMPIRARLWPTRAAAVPSDPMPRG
eukprot:7239549-Prymnesium_polylepis.1